MAENFVSLKNVNKIYSNGVQAVFDFNLYIKKNQFVVFVGPSGCGKSTTLRMIAGLEEISSGELYIKDKYANYIESKDRNISMVFQNYALYPQLNVFDNIAYSLKIKHLPKDEIEARVFEAAKILNLGAYLDRYPRELSGGQMQRVALGRAIVKESELFLMDEPLSNLDAKLRVQMRSEIVKIHRNVGATTIYVTHDQIEAMTMADLIVVMNKGYIQQINNPKEIYENPRNLFVATFIGTPPMNIIEGKLEKDELVINDSLKIKISKEKLAKFDEFYKAKIEEFTPLRMIETSSVYQYLIKNMYKLVKEKSKDKDKVEFSNKIKELEIENRVDEELLAIANNVVESQFNKEQIDELFNVLSKYENLVRDGLNKIKASQTFIKKEEQEELEKPKKEKISWFKRVFKKKELETIKETNDLEEIDSILSKLINDEKHIVLGIRPEKINNEKGEIKLFNGQVDAVELLGYELNVYFYINEKKIISKLDTKELVKPNEEINLFVNDEDLYYFDSITGENILFVEKSYEE